MFSYRTGSSKAEDTITSLRRALSKTTVANLKRQSCFTQAWEPDPGFTGTTNGVSEPVMIRK